MGSLPKLSLCLWTEIEARAEEIVVFDRCPFYETCMSEVIFTKKVSLISSNYKSLRYKDTKLRSSNFELRVTEV